MKIERQKKIHFQLNTRLTTDQFKALQKEKLENPKIKTNADLFTELYEAWINKKEVESQAQEIQKLIREIRLIKEQVAINNEMVADLMNYHDRNKILLGIDAQIYKDAKKLVHERMLDAEEKSNL
ncbi:hypothetical protein [Lactobacillus sp. ESL0681]|uniref:hypothetical protein n=1 Tax=Lactobacillus sp. ESL0681 TaxID=2983211 RepID=UPI0023F9210E|nr:hypothetical protein [Lactobacillus sp. ESL0681]WEV41281.1 hypothetical protein OZX59_09445 [Lactobacillus sp. ESL0681]